jgi:hemolysin D
MKTSDEEYEATKIEIGKLEKSLPFITKRVKLASELREKKQLTESRFLQLEQSRIEQSHRLATEKQHLIQLQAMRIQAQQKIDSLKTETMLGVMETILENRREIRAIQQVLVNTDDLDQRQILSAPVTGQVQELAIKTEGDVVYETEPLMKIAPDEAPLVVEVFVKSRDIGLVEKKMPVEMKIDTFPYPKSGSIEAVVETISDDATFDEKRGYTYSMLLAMKDKTIAVEGREVQLIPGMEVTAEIKMGERRLIEYFLVPLMFNRRGSLEE